MTAAELETLVLRLVTEGASLGQALTDTFPGVRHDRTLDPNGDLIEGDPSEAMPGLTVETWQTVRDRMLR